MYRLIIMVIALTGIFSCSDPNPCTEFIDEADIRIHQHYDCNELGEVELVLSSSLDRDSEEIQNLDLTYEWSILGRPYQGSHIKTLAGEEDQVELMIFNAGCSVTTVFDIDRTQRYQGAIGNKVWIDEGPELNCFELGDTPLEGFLVELRDPVDWTVIDEYITDEFGHYLFYNLSPGDYIIRFVNTDQSMEFVSRAHCGNQFDSDCDVQGYTETVTLSPCDVILTVDAGLRKH